MEYSLNGTKLYTDYFTVTPGRPVPWVRAYDGLFGKSREGLELLRAYRDGVLAATPLGRTYIQRLYARSHEIANLLILQPRLMQQARMVITLLRPQIQEIVFGGTGSLSQEDLFRLQTFLDELALEASPELRTLILNVKADLENPETLSGFGLVVD